MTKGPCIIYITAGQARIGWLADQPQKGPFFEERMALQHTDDDCRRFAAFFGNAKVLPERLVLCIPRARAVARFLRFPSWDEREIQRMVEYELDTVFPYKSDEFVSGYSILKKIPGGYAQVLVTAVQRRVIGEYIDFMRCSRLRPDEIWISTQALCNAFSARHYPGSICLVHVDDGFAELLFFKDGTLIFDRAVYFSGNGGYETAVTLELLRNREFVCERLIVAGNPASATAAGEYIRDLAGALGCAAEVDPEVSVIHGLGHAGMEGKINLLPQELKADRIFSARRKKIMIAGGVLLLNVFLLVNLVFVRQAMHRQYLAHLSARIKTMDAETVVLQKKLSRLKQYEYAVGSGRYKLELLCELAAACPAEVLLNLLDVGGAEHTGELTAAGRARDADAVLRFASALKVSGMVTHADVSYINKRPDAGEWVDFEIRAGY